MYDSVYPTRTARFGVALVPQGMLKLKNAQFGADYRWGRAGVWREVAGRAERLRACRATTPLG